AVEELLIEAFVSWILTERAVRLGEVVGQQNVPPLAGGTGRQLRHQACPGLMNKTARRGLGQRRTTDRNVILQIERGQNCRRHVGDAAEHTRYMVIAEDRWGIAAAGAQLVFGDLVGPGNLATSGLDLVRSAPLRERMNIETRVGAVELRTDR